MKRVDASCRSTTKMTKRSTTSELRDTGLVTFQTSSQISLQKRSISLGHLMSLWCQEPRLCSQSLRRLSRAFSWPMVKPLTKSRQFSVVLSQFRNTAWKKLISQVRKQGVWHLQHKSLKGYLQRFQINNLKLPNIMGSFFVTNSTCKKTMFLYTASDLNLWLHVYSIVL